MTALANPISPSAAARREAEDNQGCDTWEPQYHSYDESPNTYPDSLEIRANTAFNDIYHIALLTFIKLRCL